MKTTLSQSRQAFLDAHAANQRNEEHPLLDYLIDLAGEELTRTPSYKHYTEAEQEVWMTAYIGELLKRGMLPRFCFDVPLTGAEVEEVVLASGKTEIPYGLCARCGGLKSLSVRDSRIYSARSCGKRCPLAAPNHRRSWASIAENLNEMAEPELAEPLAAALGFLVDPRPQTDG